MLATSLYHVHCQTRVQVPRTRAINGDSVASIVAAAVAAGEAGQT